MTQPEGTRGGGLRSRVTDVDMNLRGDAEGHPGEGSVSKLDVLLLLMTGGTPFCGVSGGHPRLHRPWRGTPCHNPVSASPA